MTTAKLSSADKLYLGVQLTRTLLRNITTRLEADLAGTGISVGQRAILEVLLLKGQATAPQIVGILDVTRQFVARELKTLTQSGMVLMRDNPQHQKSPFYVLGAQSEKTISDVRNHEMEQFTKFVGRFSAEEIDAFLRVQMALNEEFSKT